MLGIVLYYLYRDHIVIGSISKRFGRSLSVAGSSMFVMLVFFIPRSIESVLHGRNLLLGISFLVFVLGCSAQHSRPFINEPSIFLGLIIYSLYLLRLPIIAILLPLYTRIYSGAIPATLSYRLCLFITLVVLVPASSFAFEFIEKPGMALGKVLIKRLAPHHRRATPLSISKL